MTLSPAGMADARSRLAIEARPLPLAWPRAVDYLQAAVGVVALSLALRLLVAAWLPLTADEAYAVAVSRSHALSYYDHPPMMFALARAMADLSGREDALLMRLPFVAMGTASMLLLYDITRRAFDAKAAFWALSAFACAPFFFSFGQLLIVPDGPLDFGLLACLWCIQPVLSGQDGAAWRWPAAGLALGFALLSKYQAVLFGVSAVGALALNPQWRRLFLMPGPWVAVLLAFAGTVPVIVWNAEHGWISFAFQTGRAYQHQTIASHISNFVGVLAGQAIYLLPGLWLTTQRAVRDGLRSGTGFERLLVILAIVPIVVFDVIALFGRHSLAHWAMSGFLFALPLAGKLRAAAPVSGKRLRLALSALVVAGLSLSVCLQASPDALPGLPGPGWQNLDWTPLRSALPADGRFVLTPDWVSAGRAGVALGAAHPIRVASDPHQFQFMNAGSSPRGYYVSAFPSPQVVPAISLPSGYAPAGPMRWIEPGHGKHGFALIIVPVSRSVAMTQ